MNVRHWSDDQFIDRLYGVGPADPELESHLPSCAICSERWREIAEARRGMLAAQDVPHEFLAAQRRAIYRRLGSSPRGFSWPRWAAAGVTALMLTVAVLSFRSDHRKVAVDENSDAQFFSEMYSLEQRSEPRAAQPIHALFEE